MPHCRPRRDSDPSCCHYCKATVAVGETIVAQAQYRYHEQCWSDRKPNAVAAGTAVGGWRKKNRTPPGERP